MGVEDAMAISVIATYVLLSMSSSVWVVMYYINSYNIKKTKYLEIKCTKTRKYK